MKISVINGERWNLAWRFCFSLVGRHGRKYDIILYIKPTLLQLLTAASFEAINSNRHSMQCWLFHKQKNSLWVTCCWKKCLSFLLLTRQCHFYLVTMLCMQQNCNDSKICYMQTELWAHYEKKSSRLLEQLKSSEYIIYGESIFVYNS